LLLLLLAPLLLLRAVVALVPLVLLRAVVAVVAVAVYLSVFMFTYVDDV